MGLFQSQRQYDAYLAAIHYFDYISRTDSTIVQTAKHFGDPPTTVHKRLKLLDGPAQLELREIFKRHKKRCVYAAAAARRKR